MSDDLATAILAAASPEPAASPSEPPLPPALPEMPQAPEFAGKTFTFSLRDALIDLHFSVTPDVSQATFATMVCVAVADDGRIAVATSKTENVRNFDEAQEALKARSAAIAALGVKTN